LAVEYIDLTHQGKQSIKVCFVADGHVMEAYVGYSKLDHDRFFTAIPQGGDAKIGSYPLFAINMAWEGKAPVKAPEPVPPKQEESVEETITEDDPDDDNDAADDAADETEGAEAEAAETETEAAEDAAADADADGTSAEDGEQTEVQNEDEVDAEDDADAEAEEDADAEAEPEEVAEPEAEMEAPAANAVLVMPEGQTVLFEGDEVNLKAVLTAPTEAELEYNWQFSDDSGATWTSVPNSNTDTLTITVHEAQNQRLWRVGTRFAQKEVEQK
ncbi:MAG: hypothetical protein Q4C54_07405, partial [Clostridia bacterium]|nr:hypothetical protein [Clostridia bacterium]